MRLNTQTGTESLPVSSLNCDRPLRSGIRVPETVMSTGGQITDEEFCGRRPTHLEQSASCPSNRNALASDVRPTSQEPPV